jgi:K+-sensing histidine kinase KdpD
MAILSWIVFTVAIGFIKPPPHSCWREMNSTHQIIERVGYSTSTITSNTKLIVKRQTIKISSTTTSINKIIDRQNRTRSSTSRRRKTTTLAPKVLQEDDSIDSSEEDNPINENNQVTSMNFLPINKPKNTMGNPLSITHTNLSLVKPLASPILYEKKDVRNVFMVFLLLIIVGEFFSAPAITLAVSSYLSLHC